MDLQQALVHQSSDPAFLLDTGRGTILEWNNGASALLGHTAQEVTGEPCWRVLRGVTAGGAPFCTPGCQATMCFRRGMPFGSEELHVLHKDGHRVPVVFSSLLFPPPTGATPAPFALVFLHPKEPSSSSPPPFTLRLCCLGPLYLLRGTEPLDWRRWKRKQAIALLAFLVHYRGTPVHRELIMEALWPDAPTEAAKERLKVVVYSLRRELGDLEGSVVVRQGATYFLEPGAVWIDVIAFQQLLDTGSRLARSGRRGEAVVALEAAQALYRGSYLEEEPYAEWAQLERYSLAERYLDLLHALGGLYVGQGRYREAAHVFRLALTQDPSREEFHRLLAGALSALGERAAALQQIRSCEEFLRNELGVALSQETRTLRETLLLADPVAPA